MSSAVDTPKTQVSYPRFVRYRASKIHILVESNPNEAVCGFAPGPAHLRATRWSDVAARSGPACETCRQTVADALTYYTQQ